MTAKRSVIAFLLFWLVTPFIGTAQEHTKDSMETLKKNLSDKKAILLDVREEPEWKAGHLEQAILLPLSKLKEGADPKTVIKDLDAKKIVYLHCKSGGRCVTAAEYFKKLGYDARPLKQGYDDLLKAGLPKAKE